jgi:tripartite-type tricarboxylate transporter receptor subunit TctC
MESDMKLRRRQVLRLAAGAVAFPIMSQSARALNYPARPVRLVVGFAPGGSTDLIARLTGQGLSSRLGQPFIVENRPGAGSNIGTEAVIESAPDGHTLLLAVTTNAINATLYGGLKFNFVRDVAAVAAIVRQPFVMVINPLIPVTTVAEFITFAKTNPGKVNMASAGNGTPHHVFGELFMAMTDVRMLHVPYRGDAPALTDLLSGQVQVMFAPISSTIGYVKAGSLRPLSITTAVRSDALPNIPALSEYVSGFEASAWAGIIAPRYTPPEIIDKLNKEINVGLADPQMKARLADLGATVIAGSPADFERLIKNETEKWANVIRTADIKVD